MRETLQYEGVIFVRKPPEDWTEEQYRYWWLPDIDAKGQIIRPARMSQREKERYTVAEGHNILTANGKQLILTYISMPGSYGSFFSQVFSVGTGAISGVQPSDTGVAGEFSGCRVALSQGAISGNQVDISASYTGSNGNGTWTNGGIYGNGASTTLATGALLTHALMNYPKSTGTVIVDYLIVLTG